MKSALLTACAILFLLTGQNAFAQKTVVIDAGHGGQDRGGLPGQRISEKTLTLDVAQRLEKILRASGVRTAMTRKRDVYVPLSGRTAMANRYRNSIFVSIHFNAAQRRGARGIETFYYGAASRSLANSIQTQLIRATNTENRGVKKRGFYVLRNTRSPAVLVECGFLTNPAEAKLCLRADHRQRLAQQIARGILQNLGHRVLPAPSRSAPVIASKPVARPATARAAKSIPSPTPSRVPAPSTPVNRASDEELKRRFLMATGRVP